jgi:carboxylesterase
MDNQDTIHTTTSSTLSQNDNGKKRFPRVGVLLVHGLNGSKRDMEELTEAFLQQGMIPENILLPGHGSHVREMLSVGWVEWAKAVQDELRALKSRCDVVFLVGHSLGGALCLHVAAHEEVAGVVAMCAPIRMPSWMVPAIKLTQMVTPIVPTLREDVRDRAARRRYARESYRWTPMAPVASMLKFLPELREELPRIIAPSLVMVSTHDHVVPARDGYEIYQLLGAKEKTLLTLHRSFHVIMKDHDREEVFTKTLDFVHRYAATASHHVVEP